MGYFSHLYLWSFPDDVSPGGCTEVKGRVHWKLGGLVCLQTDAPDVSSMCYSKTDKRLLYP